MRVVLGVVVRRDGGVSPGRGMQQLTRRVLGWADTLVLRSFPTREPLHRDVVELEGSNGFLAVWSNQPGDAAGILTHHEDAHRVVVGYTHGEDVATVPPHADLLEVSGRLGGNFSLFQARQRSVTAVTDAQRTAPVYVAESPRLRVLSTRALLAHLVTRLDTPGRSADPATVRPVVDPVTSSRLATGARFLGAETPFVGTSAVYGSTAVMIDPWFVRDRARHVERVPAEEIGRDDYAGLVAGVAEQVVRACSVVGPQVSLGLSGGRDSRVLAASLAAAGTRVSASTRGLRDNPDVVIATEVARRLGLRHTVSLPGGAVPKGSTVEHPLTRIRRNLDVFDGQVAAWNDMPDYGPYNDTPSMSGAGGELLRGGLIMSGHTTLTTGKVQTELYRNVLGHTGLVQPWVTQRYRQFAQPWIDLARTDPWAAADSYYTMARLGWATMRRAGARSRRDHRDPLLDNLVAQAVRAVPARLRWDEQLVFDVIAHLAPSLRDLPVEGRRWRFERHGPRSSAAADERDAWGAREGLRTPEATRQEAAWLDWRRLQHRYPRALMTELIRERLGPDLAPVYDLGALAALTDPSTSTASNRIWETASALVLMRDPWHDGSRPAPRAMASLIGPDPC